MHLQVGGKHSCIWGEMQTTLMHEYTTSTYNVQNAISKESGLNHSNLNTVENTILFSLSKHLVDMSAVSSRTQL